MNEPLSFMINCGFAHKSYIQTIKGNLIGAWTIDRKNLSPENSKALRTNIIIFNKDGTCILPESETFKNREATWTVNAKDITVHISCYSASNPFHGVYHIYFLSDEGEKPLRLSLTSLNINLLCTADNLVFSSKKYFSQYISKI